MQLMWWLHSAICPVEKGQPTPQPSQSHCWPVPDNDKPCPPAKQQQYFLEDEMRLLCARWWNLYRSSLQKNDLSSAFFVWGILISCQKVRLWNMQNPIHSTGIFYESMSILPGQPKGLSVMSVGWSCLNRIVFQITQRYHGTVLRGSTQGRLPLKCQNQTWLMSS